jgi:tRNA (guanosine-2'-O-)-methyltransferase
MNHDKLFQTEDILLRKRLIEKLEEFVNPDRLARLREVIRQRTRYLTVVVEDLYQSQNISAVMRTCECYGIQDVHVIQNDHEYRVHNAISMGANKWLTEYRYEHEEHNTEKCLLKLKQAGYKIVVTLPNNDSCFIQDYPVSKKTAFVFGTELTGISSQAIALSDASVKIPMYGFTESFNISNSVAILLSCFVEKIRQAQIKWQLSETEQDEIYFEWLQKSIKHPHLLINRLF